MNTPLSTRRLLPASWADRIFDRLQGFYGSLWVDRWRTGEADKDGRDIGLLNAKATWASELGGFAEQPERIQRAIEACRHRPLPPTLPEFLDLCRQAQPDAVHALPAPKVAPEVARQRAGEIKACADMIASKPREYYRAWARKIVAKPEAYPPISLKLAREALAAPEAR